MKFVLVFLIITHTCPWGFSQNKEFIVIEGVVKDQKTKKPIPYANVTLSDNKVGTVTNDQGVFRLVLPENLTSGVIHVSHIGYQTRSYTQVQVNSTTEILLAEDTQTLKEIVITDFTVETLIKRAIDRIAENYYAQSYHSKGFYRLTSKKEMDYVRISEAIFDLFHIRPVKSNQFKLEKMRAIKDQQALEHLDVGLKPQNILEFDIVNTLETWDIINKKGMSYHRFALEGEAQYEDQDVYVVSFNQNEGIKKAAYQGRFFIDKSSLAFVYFDFGLSPVGMTHHTYGNFTQRALMKMLNLDLTVQREHFDIYYRKLGNKYYLSKARINHDLSVTNNKGSEPYTLKNKVDYLVMDVQLENHLPHSRSDVLADGKWIERQEDFYDPDFWNSHNVILPGFDYKQVATRITTRNMMLDSE